MIRHQTVACVVAALLALWGAVLLWASAQARADGESAVPCTVVRVSDGDTLRCVMAPPLWGPYRETVVRVAGIDTPESRMPPARCAKEARLGAIAKFEMKKRAPSGAVLRITWTGEHEKWGRVLARVTLPDGRDWAAELIRLGLARSYAGGTKSDWCR